MYMMSITIVTSVRMIKFCLTRTQRKMDTGCTDRIREVCRSCPFLNQCTQSKDHTKRISRHIWAHYIEEADHLRHTEENKQIYAKRKETIERVFADMKEKHGMRMDNLKRT
jgi:hypothetical protein